MSLFGIFHGWFSRKKGLFDKLKDDIRIKVLQTYSNILKQYTLKTEFLEHPSETGFKKLKETLNVESALENIEESFVNKTIKDLDEIFKQERITTIQAIGHFEQRKFETQLRNELYQLRFDLASLKKILQTQYSILNTSYKELNIEAFKTKVKEEGRILTVEKNEINKIQREFEEMLLMETENFLYDLVQVRDASKEADIPVDVQHKLAVLLTEHLSELKALTKSKKYVRKFLLNYLLEVVDLIDEKTWANIFNGFLDLLNENDNLFRNLIELLPSFKHALNKTNVREVIQAFIKFHKIYEIIEPHLEPYLGTYLSRYFKNSRFLINNYKDFVDAINFFESHKKYFKQYRCQFRKTLYVESIEKLFQIWQKVIIIIVDDKFFTVQDLRRHNYICVHVTNAYAGGEAGAVTIKQDSIKNIAYDILVTARNDAVLRIKEKLKIIDKSFEGTNIVNYQPSASIVQIGSQNLTFYNAGQGSIGVIYDYGYIYESYDRDAFTYEVRGKKSGQNYRTARGLGSVEHKAPVELILFLATLQIKELYNEVLIRNWTINSIFYQKGVASETIEMLKQLSDILSGEYYKNGAYIYREGNIRVPEYIKKKFPVYEIDGDDNTLKLVYQPEIKESVLKVA